MQPQVVGGRYELIGEIGAGGMGLVYEGFDRHLKRRIAVKFTRPSLDNDPGWAKRFLREAELMARIRHPGLPTIYDAGMAAGNPGRPYLVMEYVDGVTFAALLLRHGPLPVGVVAALGAQTAAVLAAAHRHRIYHRDLKPSNLMLCADATVKVLDFGLAVALDADMTRYTSTGHTLGTPAFMAPEQVEGKPVVPQTDIYALGLVLHELLSGQPVMTGATPFVVWQNQIHLPSPDIRNVRPDVPDVVADLIADMLAKSPAQRPADAAAVHAVLLEHAADLGILPEVDDLPSPTVLYALAVGKGGGAGMPGSTAIDIPCVEPGSETRAAAVGLTRAELRQAVERAHDRFDVSMLETVVTEFETIVEAAVPLFGSRDADVIEAREQLAALRFDQRDYSAASAFYRALIDDLTSELGPYDDQVMRCQRQLARCDANGGDRKAARARLAGLHTQMAVRYGEQDRRVIELATEIREIGIG
ncbi:serine/threonine-protein kinase [Nocardia ignorata]|uniref:Serine/threonine protein kinase n=1 Tax=Nocardia ignorata TaxID=145285 RepID=A0A4R6P037_NOCIG|nr:serine/threonine-protein kinase [Nocardia ignorata]TDP30807.1 serine/threonine protein kinase [Nocardia ignorata]